MMLKWIQIRTKSSFSKKGDGQPTKKVNAYIYIIYSIYLQIELDPVE